MGKAYGSFGVKTIRDKIFSGTLCSTAVIDPHAKISQIE